MHDLVRFDLNLLVAFDVLMTERGVTRAGRRLGITQAAMSNTLRRLRDIFDDPLFVKIGLRMEPTARALELAGPVERALREVRQALNQERFDPSHAQHLFRIGMVDYASVLLLAPLVELLRVKAPGVALELVDIGGEDERTVLESGAADLVFSRFQWVPPNILLHRVFQMQFVCIFRQDHPLVPDGKLTLDAFLDADHVHFYPRGMTSTVVDEALANLGRSRSIKARMYSLGVIPFMVAQSDLMAVLPDRVARQIAKPLGLGFAPVPVSTPPLRMAIAWHPRTEKSPPNIWLREQVKTILEGLPEG
ncbi:MAG: LysR family transcriptional regulator [Magnetococcales bacterium]|nr:LysR family transcriptional regulator [Magnetococcales bacterium]NGZ05521.1 LysR family transcriptional regulator [Magnetococcales bacterium]